MRWALVVVLLAACGGRHGASPGPPADAGLALEDDAGPPPPRATGVEAARRCEHALTEASQLVAAGRSADVKATCELTLEVTRGALASSDSPTYKRLETLCLDKVYPAALEHDLGLIREARGSKDDTLGFECEKDRAVWEAVKTAGRARGQLIEAFAKACAQPWAEAGSLR